MTHKQMVAAWSKAHGEQAQSEGWDIFSVDSFLDPTREVDGKPYGVRPFELQQVDELNKFFGDDRRAWRHVVSRAKAGDACAQQALAVLKVVSPGEYDAIVRLPAAA